MEDTIRAGQRHYDRVQLLTDLRNRLRKVLIQRHKRHQSTKRQSAIALQCKNRADHRAKHVADISQIGINRHQDIGKGVRLLHVHAQFLIALLKLLQALLLVTEYFHDFLALFTISSTEPCQGTDGLLLRNK